MYLVYTSVLTLGLLLTLPYYIVRFRKYFPTIGERLGFLEPGPEGPTIWVHAVSVGEVRAVDRLIAGIRDSRRRSTVGDRPDSLASRSTRSRSVTPMSPSAFSNAS